MAVVSLISDDLDGYADGVDLTTTAQWRAYTRTGSGVMQSDAHSDHAPGQVIDMTNTGYAFALHEIDTLDSDDHTVELLAFHDKVDGQINSTEFGVILRAQTNDPVAVDGYLVGFMADYDAGFKSINVTMERLDGSVQTVLASAFNVHLYVERWGVNRLTATISGTVITAYLNGREVLAYDTAPDPTKYATGRNVGFGINRIRTGTDNQPFACGFRAWTVNQATKPYTDIIQAVSAGTSDPNGGTIAVAMSAPTAGNLLVAIAGSEDYINNAFPSLALTDNGTGSWTKNHEYLSGPSMGLVVWTKTAVGDETVVTATATEGQQGTLCVIELPSTYSLETFVGTEDVDAVTAALSSSQKLGVAVSVSGSVVTKLTALNAERYLVYNTGNSDSGNVGLARFALAVNDLGTSTAAWTVTDDTASVTLTGALVFAKAGGGENKTTTGAASLSLSASGADVKVGAVTGASQLVLDAPADAAKAGTSTSSTSFALAASGTDVKSGVVTGTTNVALSAAATPTSKDVAANGSTSLALAAAGSVGAVESKSTTGATSLTFSTSAAAGKHVGATGATSVALAAAGVAAKIGSTVGSGPLTLSGVASPTSKGVAATGAATFAFTAVGLVGAAADKSVTASTSLSTSLSAAAVKAGDATAATSVTLSASGVVSKTVAAITTSGLALGGAAAAAKSVPVTAATSLLFAATGFAGAVEVKSVTGSTSLGFNLSASVVKTGAPYGTAAITFGMSGGAVVKAGATAGAVPIVFATVGTAAKTISVAGATTLAVGVAVTAAKATTTIGSTALTFVNAGSAAIGDGSYAPDPGRTLTVGDHDRVLRVQPRQRTIHVAPADRRFTWR